MRKYLYPAIGAAAFVVGGLVARQKAFDVVETLETTFAKKPSPADRQRQDMGLGTTKTIPNN